MLFPVPQGSLLLPRPFGVRNPQQRGAGCSHPLKPQGAFLCRVIVKYTGFGLLPHPTGMKDALETHEVILGSYRSSQFLPSCSPDLYIWVDRTHVVRIFKASNSCIHDF